jgi:hypothetical protein
MAKGKKRVPTKMSQDLEMQGIMQLAEIINKSAPPAHNVDKLAMAILAGVHIALMDPNEATALLKRADELAKGRASIAGAAGLTVLKTARQLFSMGKESGEQLLTIGKAKNLKH